MLDFSTDLGKRIGKQLESEHTIWLTTVGSDDTPQPRPVWFVWDGEALLVYSEPNTHKLRHIERSPRVAVHFNTDFEGEHVGVLTGDAWVDPNAPPPDKNQEYLTKYSRGIAALGMTPEQVARDYNVALRITPTKMRGH